MVDAFGLSASERQALLMLAEGHTAKSIAAELGVPVGAVNERLREARRKTGAGSSRELARALKACGAAPPENRPKEIGAPPATAQAETDPRPGRRLSWPFLIGVFAMAIVGSTVGALLALSLGASHSAGPPRVTATRPAQGAVVPAGDLVLQVTFDQPMRAGGYSFVVVEVGAFPTCAGQPVQSADLRSFTLRCRVEAGRSYALGFNNAAHHNFTNAAGLAATPAVLRFSAR